MPVLDPASTQQYVDQTRYAPMSMSRPAPHREELWPYWMLLGGQGADAATSLMAQRDPNMREGNPMGTAVTMLAKAGVTAAIAALMHRAHNKGDEKTQRTLGTIGGILGMAPAAWNIRQMTK
ncbi:MAG: hypothetical protein NUW01_12255 [Gemmatimonadaceae bacterium]|nr:hypothetical protein [Gemmatimonadaceae bacterium]